MNLKELIPISLIYFPEIQKSLNKYASHLLHLQEVPSTRNTISIKMATCSVLKLPHDFN